MKENIEVSEETQELLTEDVVYKRGVYVAIWWVAILLLFFVLWFYAFLQSNRLEAEQAKPKTIEEIRVYNYKYSEVYQKQAILLRDNAQKVVDRYNKEIRDAEYCLEHNSVWGTASDCFILTRKLK